MNPTTVMRMETGSIAAPGLDKLARIAQVLGISGADVFALAGYTVPADLPRLRPYFYAKYPGLQGEDLDKIETYVARLARKRGVEPVEAANRDAETPER